MPALAASIILLLAAFLAAFSWWHLHLAFLRKHRRASTCLLLAALAFTALPTFLHFACRCQLPAGFSVLHNIWIAWLFWLTCTGLLTDAWNLLCLLLRLPFPRASRWRLSWKTEECFALSILLLFSTWGYWHAGKLKLHKIDLEIPDLPPHAEGYRILFFSDIHITDYFRTRLLDQLVAYGQQTQPDLLLSGGDFLDGSLTPDMENLLQRFHDIHTRNGFFAVFGNHDSYKGAELSLQAHQLAGATVLTSLPNPLTRENAAVSVDIQDWLRLTAIEEDFFLRDHQIDCGQIPIQPLPEHKIGILLKHRPGTTPNILNSGYSLMLSGHLHGGQIFPFGILVWAIHHRRSGVLQETGGPLLYVTTGAGYWGMPFRVGTTQEAVLFTLHRPK